MKTPYRGLPANDPLAPELERIAMKYESDASWYPNSAVEHRAKLLNDASYLRRAAKIVEEMEVRAYIEKTHGAGILTSEEDNISQKSG